MRTDENVLPMDQVIGKTIHQRNKSSPALSTAAANMAKTGTKRSAFGDLSNVQQQVRPSKDDSALPAKHSSNLQSKPVPSWAQGFPLYKPAQRPVSTNNPRNILTTTSTVLDTAVPQQQPQPNSRKVLSKRITTVFKDSVVPLETVLEQEVNNHVSIPQSDVSYSSATTTQEPRQPTTSTDVLILPPSQAIKLAIEPVKETPLLSDSSLPGIESVSLGPEKISAPQVYDEYAVDPVKRELSGTNATSYPSLQQIQPSQQIIKSALAPYVVTEQSIASTALPPSDPKAISYPAPGEIEEYWEEEEETPVEDEGFVTARSFRFKGESTTGGATTIIFPQVNQRVRKELKAATEFVEATRNPEEVEDELYDTSMVAEYGEEIFEYMKELEIKMLPNAHYMENQHEIQWSMRSVLMDWLVQVHHRFNLLPETLFLTVNYIDRFLSCKVVSLGKLQLVGATAIFIAAKYEEINCPSIQEIVYMVDNGYSVDELLKAERFMLTMLHFELGWPGPMSFLRRISKADDYDLETRTLAKYFLEVTIMDERFIGSPPSFSAAASHCLARMMLRKGDWVSL